METSPVNALINYVIEEDVTVSQIDYYHLLPGGTVQSANMHSLKQNESSGLVLS